MTRQRGPMVSPDAESADGHRPVDPAVDALIREIIGRVADERAMLVLEELGTLRFPEVGPTVVGISQMLLTRAARPQRMDDLMARTVHTTVTPRNDSAPTSPGDRPGAASCGLSTRARINRDAIERPRRASRAGAATSNDEAKP